MRSFSGGAGEHAWHAQERAGGCLKQHEGVGVEVTAWGRVTLKLTRKTSLSSDMRSRDRGGRGLRRSDSC